MIKGTLMRPETDRSFLLDNYSTGNYLLAGKKLFNLYCCIEELLIS